MPSELCREKEKQFLVCWVYDIPALPDPSRTSSYIISLSALFHSVAQFVFVSPFILVFMQQMHPVRDGQCSSLDDDHLMDSCISSGKLFLIVGILYGAMIFFIGVPHLTRHGASNKFAIFVERTFSTLASTLSLLVHGHLFSEPGSGLPPVLVVVPLAAP